MSKILDKLNDVQRLAVTSEAKHLLIVAVAGSGKTSVLTHRITYLIEEKHISPFGILAVTFTNKAAAEMRHRIEHLLNNNHDEDTRQHGFFQSARSMWVGTFHSIAHRLLRTHYKEANLPENFQILDSDDQQRLIKRIVKSFELDETQWSAKQVQSYINSQKDQGLRAKHIQPSKSRHEETLRKLYTAYEESCSLSGMVDFAELLLRSHELWRDNPELLQQYRRRFKHILVDEFQDTNALQYAWLRILVDAENHLMIVGDDDQSIYGWRGAKIENILNFERDFPDCEVIRLEQNYRSSGNILAAANAVIDHNGDRLGKNLWTEGPKGESIGLYAAFNELDEARFIIGRIQDWHQQGNRYEETAILYRSNAQSRVLEETLLRNNIPYRVYGGQRFFERMEIKDALAYLRLINNPHDDPAFERVINTPTRGIGDRSLIAVRQHAQANKISLWEAAAHIVREGNLPARANNALQAFLTLIQNLREDTLTLNLSEQTEHVIQHSGLLTHFEKERGEKGQMRLENLAELVTATREFDPAVIDTEEQVSTLQAFLSHVALEAGEQQGNPDQDCVQLMTLHSAKGLEFPMVFLAGLEEGLFPHQMSFEDPQRLEEERRLCYVGITRAMQKLFISFAETRRLYGTEVSSRPSRFIREIPREVLQEVRLKNQINRPVYSHSTQKKISAHEPFLRLGQTVIHQNFGEGIVLNYEGEGSQARVQVKFSEGTKWLVASYANLKTV